MHAGVVTLRHACTSRSSTADPPRDHDRALRTTECIRATRRCASHLRRRARSTLDRATRHAGRFVRRLSRATHHRPRREADAVRRARLGRQSVPALRQRRAGLVGTAAIRRVALAIRDGRPGAAARARARTSSPPSCGTGDRIIPSRSTASAPAFLLQADSPNEAAANTGPGWKLLRDSAYAEVRVRNDDVRAYYAAAQGERVDGARYPWGWERRDYDDSRWYAIPASPRGTDGEPAIVGDVHLHAVPGRGGYGDAGGWQLEPRDIPPMEETPIRFAAVRAATGVPASDGFIRGAGELVVPANSRASLVLDHGRTTNAYTVLETSGGAGATITLTYAEAAIDSAGRKGNRNDVAGRTIRGIHDVIQPGGGERRRFQTLYWRSGRYVKLDVETGAEPLRMHDVSGIFTAYPFVERGRFSSDLRLARRRVADELERRAHRRVRDVHGHAVLRAAPVHRRHAAAGAHLALRRRRRPARAPGDRALRRVAHPGRDHGEPVSVASCSSSSRPSRSSTSRWCTTTSCIATIRAFVRQRLAGIHGILDWYGRRVDCHRHARPDALLELRRLGRAVGARRARRRRRRQLGDDQPSLRLRPRSRGRAREELGVRGLARRVSRSRRLAAARRARSCVGLERESSSATLPTRPRSASRRTCSPSSPMRCPPRSSAR